MNAKIIVLTAIKGHEASLILYKNIILTFYHITRLKKFMIISKMKKIRLFAIVIILCTYFIYNMYISVNLKTFDVLYRQMKAR
ncbi:hypothetical protein SH2C18_31900 [Clostridium sediminicola]